MKWRRGITLGLRVLVWVEIQKRPLPFEMKLEFQNLECFDNTLGKEGFLEISKFEIMILQSWKIMSVSNKCLKEE